MAIERIEVYLNNSTQPVQVLTQGPFNIKLDTRSLPDGEHQLKVVTHYHNGSQAVKHIPFNVANTPAMLVQGLEPGKDVHGDLEVNLRVADPEVRATPMPFPGLGLALTTALLLLGIWAYFAISGNATAGVIKEVTANAAAGSHGAAAGGDHGAAASAEYDKALYAEGETLYGQSCAGCHQATGAGNPPAFPALAGNKNLADAKLVVSVVHKGRNTMPPIGAAFTDEQLAAVATYVRNAWGNHYGGVSAEEAKAAK